MRALGRDNDRWGRAPVGEDFGQRVTDGSHVIGGNAERGGREADLGNKVAELVLVEVHKSDEVCEMIMAG